jgi:hypothetical protein
MPLNYEAIGRIEQRSKWSAGITLLGAVLILGSLLVSVLKLNAVHTETAAAQKQLDTTLETLKAKTDELNQTSQKLDALQSELSFRQNVYTQLLAKNAIPPATVSTAADNAIRQDPKLGQVTPLVNIHISREDQRQKAEEVEKKLEAIGYQVPGIEYVGKRAPNTSQVRYFFQSDSGPQLQKIEDIMKQSGAAAQPQFIGLKQPPPNLRPKVFEIWFGLDYPPAA